MKPLRWLTGFRRSTRYQLLRLTVSKLKKEDVALLLEKILYEFPITQLQFFIPKWVEMLPADSELKSQILSQIKVLHEEAFTHS